MAQDPIDQQRRAKRFASESTATRRTDDSTDISNYGEDIDWDSLTIKGTCSNLEKSYLRLTSVCSAIRFDSIRYDTIGDETPNVLHPVNDKMMHTDGEYEAL